jgi:hypothetical protein
VGPAGVLADSHPGVRRELIFLRWLSEVERLLDHQVDRDAAYGAWTEGFSATEYAVEALDEAKAEFEAAWRRWLDWAKLSEW